MLLIRPRAWWFNKVPLSVLMLLLLVDGKRLTLPVIIALTGLMALVSCVANFGYALNELFDLEEDRRGGRVNAAAGGSKPAMWVVIGASAIAALALATELSGVRGGLLTAMELVLPLAYSVPPFRIKERGWPGIFADATAAHLYPAMIALVIASHLGLRVPKLALVLTAALWSFATGFRGILSHQLQSEQHDRAAGLITVVHQLGHPRLERVLVIYLLPVEVLSFSALLVQSDAHWFLAVAVCFYLGFEFVKYWVKVIPVVVFRPEGQPFLPFVDEGFYKVWGPLALSMDAAFSDVRYLAIIPLYYVFFRARVMREWQQIMLVGRNRHSLFQRSEPMKHTLT